MLNWDLLIAQVQTENLSQKETNNELSRENNREFEFSDVLEKSRQKKINDSMKHAQIDPQKIRSIQKIEKAETAGPDYFYMPKAELTEELKRDWEMLRMRSVLHSGGANAVELPENPPEFLQVGVVLDNPKEGSKGRLGKKLRAPTITESLVKDAKFRDFLEKNYQKLDKKKKKY